MKGKRCGPHIRGKKGPKEEQKCLRCRRMFLTTDKRKNHICKRCTVTIANGEVNGSYDGIYDVVGGGLAPETPLQGLEEWKIPGPEE